MKSKRLEKPFDKPKVFQNVSPQERYKQYVNSSEIPCVRCGKRPYTWGNQGLCYVCVTEENKNIGPELRKNPVEITLGMGELDFIIEEFQWLKSTSESAKWYLARIEAVYHTLLGERNRIRKASHDSE